MKRSLISSHQIIRTFASSPSPHSGHNKWSKIRHHKGAADKVRSKIFAKMALDISAAVKAGGGATDPALNAKLSNTLLKAKSLSVPKDNIEAAIKRGDSGAVDRGHSVTYEALLGEIGLVIECRTSNPTRCIHSVKSILNKVGGSLATSGYLFKRKGVVLVVLDNLNPFDKLFEDSLEAGGEDILQISSNLVEVSLFLHLFISYSLKQHTDHHTSYSTHYRRSFSTRKGSLPLLLRSRLPSRFG